MVFLFFCFFKTQMSSDSVINQIDNYVNAKMRLKEEQERRRRVQVNCLRPFLKPEFQDMASSIIECFAMAPPKNGCNEKKK